MSTEKQRLANARNFWSESNHSTDTTANATTGKPSGKPSAAKKPAPSSPKPSSPFSKPNTTSSAKNSSSTYSPTATKSTTTASTLPKTVSPSTIKETSKTTSTPLASPQSPSKKGIFSSFASKVRSMTSFSREDARAPSTTTSTTAPRELEISAPQRVVHTGHVGFGAGGVQLTGSSVPPEYHDLISKLDAKLQQMGASQLSPQEATVLMKRLLTGPRNTARPGQIGKVTSSTTSTGSGTSGSTLPSSPYGTASTTITTSSPYGSQAASNISAPIISNTAIRSTAANINTEGLKMLTQLLKERDAKITELESQLRAMRSAKQPAVDPKFVEEKRQLLQQKRDLEHQLTQLKSKTIVSASSLPRSTMSPSEISKLVEDRLKDIQAQNALEVDAIKGRLASVEKERDNLSDAKAKLEVDLARAKSASNTSRASVMPVHAEASANAAAAQRKADAEVKKLEAELKELKTRLTTVEGDRSSLESTKRSLQLRVDELESTLAKSGSAPTVEIKVLQDQLASLSSSHTKTQEQLRAENQEKHTQITKLQQQLKDAELALQAAKASESGELATIKEAFQRELDSVRAELSSLDKAKSDLQKLKDALESQLEATKAQLTAEITKASSHGDTHAKLASRITELENTLQMRTKEQQQSLDASKRELSNAQSEITTLKGEASKLKSEIEALTASLMAANTAAASASSSGSSVHSEALEQLEEQLNTALAEAKSAQARLTSALSDKDRVQKSHAELEAKLRQLTTELQSKSIQSETSGDIAHELASLEKELERERNMKNKLEDEKDILQSTIDQLKSKLTNANDAHTGFENQLKESRKELDLLRAQLADLEDAALAAPHLAPPPPPAPAPPPPSFSSSTSLASRSSPVSELNKSFLDSIKNPDVVLKRTSQILHLPVDVTDGDDILSALARSIIDRRGRMKGNSGDAIDEEDDEW